MTETATPRPRRHDSISEKIKEMIVAEGWQPGDRLPAERELMQMFGASKSSVREAISALSAQGLVRSRTGPGGGLFLAGIASARAMELLSNLFVFEPPTIAEIYAVRRELEPEMAAAVAKTIAEEDFARLEAVMHLYDALPRDAAEEYEQRLAELDFHTVLADLCRNRLLGFFCGFLQSMLREMAVCRRIYDAPNPALRDTALHYQLRLMRALRAHDSGSAREIMRDHMLAAQAYMERVEAEVRPRFLRVRR